jgi:hypothetical protein
MKKVKTPTLILTFFVLSFLWVSLSGASAEESLFADLSPLAKNSRPFLAIKGIPLFSFWEKAGVSKAQEPEPPLKTVNGRESPGKDEAPAPASSPAAVEIQKNYLYLFNHGSLWKEKSTYTLGKINLSGSDFNSFLNFFPCLSVAKFKEENSLLWNLEGYKESDLFKFLAVIFELKLNF